MSNNSDQTKDDSIVVKMGFTKRGSYVYSYVTLFRLSWNHNNYFSQNLKI